MATTKTGGASFKDSYGVQSTFTGGFCDPSDVQIVGVDLPVEDWNEDLADTFRATADDPGFQRLVDSILQVGVRDEVKVTKRRGLVLVVDGRRRTQAARAANALLKKRKADPSEYVLIPIVPDKSSDSEITVRIANEHRKEDPPWVKARNAGRLRDRGRDDDTIRAVFGVEAVTLGNWFAFLDLDPSIQTMVEKGEIPFAVGHQIGKLGKGKDRQILALDTLRNMGASLTGDTGKANVKAVVGRVKSGEITKPPPPPAPKAQAALTPSHVSAPVPVKVPAAPSAAPGPKAAKDPAPPVVTDSRLRPAVVGRILAVLEPTPAEPHETDDLALAWRISAVYAGQDPTLDGLSKWPEVRECFRKAMAMGKK